MFLEKYAALENRKIRNKIELDDENENIISEEDFVSEELNNFFLKMQLNFFK